MPESSLEKDTLFNEILNFYVFYSGPEQSRLEFQNESKVIHSVKYTKKFENIEKLNFVFKPETKYNKWKVKRTIKKVHFSKIKQTDACYLSMILKKYTLQIK